MTRPEGWMHRAPRPLIMWGGVALVAVAVIAVALFLGRIGGAIALAFERSATSGQPVPDMSGGLPALLSVVGPLLGSAVAFIWRGMSQRHRERMDQQARGQWPGPFDSSPAEGGPRPGDSP